MPKRLLLSVVLIAAMLAAVAAHNTNKMRLRRMMTHDATGPVGPQQPKSQLPKTQQPKQKPKIPSLDLGQIKEIDKLPYLNLAALSNGLPHDAFPSQPQDFMPEMASESKSKFDEYFAKFNTLLTAEKTAGHPMTAISLPEFAIAGMKVNLVFYYATTGYDQPLKRGLVKYDQAFAQAAMDHIKASFQKIHTKVVPEVFAKVKTLKVLAAPVDISSLATVWASAGQGERKSEYEAVIFIGKLAWKQIDQCDEYIRGALVADSYTNAVKDATKRPWAFFLHEFGHVVMMTTQTEQFQTMVSKCVEQLKINGQYPQLADSMYTFLKSINAVPIETMSAATPYYGNLYNLKATMEISTYAVAKPAVCGYLEYIPEVWSGALLGMPPTTGNWAEDFFKLLVPGMPLNREPALEGWCPAKKITVVADAPLRPPTKKNK